MIFFLLAACDMPEPAPPPKAEKPACDLTVATLPGTSWVYNAPQPTGPNKPDPTARVRFDGTEAALTAKYTAGSSSDVFDYTCTVKGGIVSCLESEPHADAFCKAWAAVHDGVCDPAGVSAAAGIPLEAATKAAETVNAELKKLKGEELAAQRKADNSPNNKMRGKFNAAIDKGTCGLTLQDKYQTMVDGKLNEYENVIGAGKFVKAPAEYTWDSCKDADSAWAPGPDDKHLAVQGPGTIKFSAMLQKDQKGAADCTYTADTYVDWVKGQSGLTAVNDPTWGPRWDVSVPLADKGKHVVYFDRTRTCAGKTEKIGNTCAMVRIE